MTEPINRRAALYARVSTEQQAQEDTIASQLDLVHRRVQTDGLTVAQELQFADDGYSGETFRRPALERLRDTAAAGAIDRLYIECPDRLARDYPYQMVLVDELRRQGVEVVFLNRDLDESPEGRLLLQVQGIIAEYERVKIREKCRRGRLYAARSGQVSALGGAPYGYHYHTKQEGGGEARYVIQFAEAQVVQEIFTWIGIEGCSLSQMCKRLQERGLVTRTGKARWDRATVLGMLRNPAYMGSRPVQQGPLRTGPAAAAPPSRRPRVSPATHRQGGHARRGPDPDRGPGDRGAGPVRRRAGAAGAAPPAPRPSGPSAALSAGGLGGVPAVRLCLSRSDPGEAGRASTWLLPMLRGGGRAVRRWGTNLRQSGDPGRPSGRGGVVRCPRVVAGAGAVG